MTLVLEGVDGVALFRADAWDFQSPVYHGVGTVEYICDQIGWGGFRRDFLLDHDIFL